MAGLQRSSETFRRSGSSGLVWEDRFLSEELKPAVADAKGGTEDGGAAAVASTLERNRPNGGGGHGGYRAGLVSPALEPPSPRVGVCGFCSFFGGKAKTNGHTKAKARRR